MTKDEAREAGAISRLLRPQRVAVIGASDQADKIGGRPIDLLLRSGFAGEIIPVNPGRAMIQGLAAYKTIAAAGGAIDAAIIAVPAESVAEALAQCGEAGVRAAVIFSSGFAEIGERGRAEQEALVAVARQHKLRFVGPNSIGLVNFAAGATLSFASVLDGTVEDGEIAVISQSGAFGIAVYSQLRERGLGVRYMCATGNQADLSVADFLAEIANDASQRAALLYIEHVPGRDLLRAAIERAVAAGLCVVAVAAGLSAHGRRSAMLHTGGSGEQRITPEFLDECGAIVATDLDDLVAKADAVLAAPSGLPPRPRLVLVSNSGASCVLAADAAAELGLPLADLAETSRARLTQALPAFSLNRNPIDLTAMLRGMPQLVPAVLDIALADANADALTFGLVAVGAGYDVAAYARACATASAHYGKPVIVYSPHSNVRTVFAAAGVPIFSSERQALAHVQLMSRLPARRRR